MPGLQVIERAARPELEARLNVRETPTIVQVRAGRAVRAAVGTRPCLRLLGRLA